MTQRLERGGRLKHGGVYGSDTPGGGGSGATGATGPSGPTGPQGATGPPDAVLTTFGFTQPAIGATVAAPVSDISEVQIGDWVFVVGAGFLRVDATAPGFLTLRNIAYYLNAIPGTVIPGGTLVTPTGSPQEPPPLGPNQFFNQATWAFDPSDISGLADDNNSGLDELHPLLHYHEIVRRWGTTSPVVTATDVVIEQMSDFPDLLDPIVLEPITPNNHSVTFFGKGSAVGGGGVFGVVVSKNRPAGQALNVDLGASAAGAVRMLLIRLAGGGHVEASSYVDSIVAGTNTLVWQPLDTATNNVEEDNYAAAQAFTVLRPTQSNVERIDNIILKRIWLPSTLVGPSIHNIQFVECRIDCSPTLLDNFSAANTLATVPLTPTGGFTWKAGALSGLTVPQGPISFVESDTGLRGTIAIYGRLGNNDFVYSDSNNLGLNRVIFVNGYFTTGVIYGNYVIDAQGRGQVVYPNTLAVSAFLGTPLLLFNTVGTGTAVDNTVDPTQLHPNRALNPANLDALVGAGGFNQGAGGIALANTTLTASFSAFNAGE